MSGQLQNSREPVRREEEAILPSFGPVLIKTVDVAVYSIPTETEESDGTISWNKTKLVLVQIRAGGHKGIGFSYADESTGNFIKEHFTELILNKDAFDIPGLWELMHRQIRNIGRPGVAGMAISAVDNALWDLKARILDIPLSKLTGQLRDGVPVYGSGGFTSYSIKELQQQFERWADKGFRMVKMKVGRDPSEDAARVRAARRAIGKQVELFVDANGAYTRKQALYMANIFAEYDVTYFEEPVSSDDLEGLAYLRQEAPPGIHIAAGEYSYDQFTFRDLLLNKAVDILQADATRCGGITGYIRAAQLAYAFNTPFSAHTAPAIHLHPSCSLANIKHLEYFYDHVRIENMLFDGVIQPKEGILYPDLSMPGNGLEFKKSDAEKFLI